jgi:hypothetical protein
VNTVLYIFPEEIWKEIYLAYGLLGSMLYTALTFYWKFDEPKRIEAPLKSQVLRIVMRTILGTIMTFILLGIYKAFFTSATTLQLLGIGVALGFFFEFYGKKSFINNLFKNIAERLMKMVNNQGNDNQQNNSNY